MTTVLLVEDELALLELIDRALSGWGYNVLPAHDGREAVAILESHTGTIDLLLSDVRLPHLSGWDLAKLSSEIRPTARCLMMSGYPDLPHSLHGLQLNCRYIQKPFELGDLLSAILELMQDGQHRV